MAECEQRVLGREPATIAARPLTSGFTRAFVVLIVYMRKVPLSWEDRACRSSCPRQTKDTFQVNTIGSARKIMLSSDGSGIVCQAGGLLLIEALRVTVVG
jgi:hypothetical protein